MNFIIRQILTILALASLLSPPARAKSPPGDSVEKSERAAKIEKIAPGKYRIAHSEVLRLLGSMAILSDQARLRPVVRDKVVAGYQIYKIRRASIFEQLGLRDEDRLTHLNEIPLDGPTRKRQLFALLNTNSELILKLRRKGKIITLRYIIGPLALTTEPEKPKKSPAEKPRKAAPKQTPSD